jgi:DNA ligase (NAD+)
MEIKKAHQRIKELVELIKQHNKFYFQEANPKISDYEYDQLKEELINLETQFPELIQADSPTQNIGADLNKKSKLIKHSTPMLSLANTYSEEEIQGFIKRITKATNSNNLEFFCELKFDGVAISLIYEKGIFKHAVSRGDGYQGDDITQNIKTIPYLPLKIKEQNTIEVRGEVFISKANFDKLNQLRKEQGEPLFSNPRNTAAGTIKTLDSSIVAKRKLDYYAYGLIEKTPTLQTHEKSIHKLQELGFRISQTYKKCQSLDDIKNYLNYWEQQKDNLELQIDGVVIKVNDLAQQKALGNTNTGPRWAIAYKYKPEKVSTILEKVIYQVGRTGSITPVAQLTPVHLSGTVIKRASLHNFNILSKLNLHYGDTVFVEKGGEIIPKITAVDLSKRKKDSSKIEYIQNCPSCNTTLQFEKEEKTHFCPNQQNCQAQIKEGIIHFASKNAMDIKNLGEKLIEKLLNKQAIKNIADIYKITKNDLIEIEGFKDLSINNVLTSIQNSVQMPFNKVIFGLGIKHVGEVVANTLAKYFADIDHIANATFEDFIKIPEIGPKIAESITNFFKEPHNKNIINHLKQAGLNLKLNAYKTTKLLENKKFVISGVFNQIDREKLKQIIEENSGKVSSSVTAKINYLVTGNKPGNEKIKKAKMLNIPIIGEEEILKMIEQ